MRLIKLTRNPTHSYTQRTSMQLIKIAILVPFVTKLFKALFDTQADEKSVNNCCFLKIKPKSRLLRVLYCIGNWNFIFLLQCSLKGWSY